MRTNPHLGYARSDLHGFVLVELDGSKFDATYHQIAVDYLLTDYADNLSALLGAFTTERFRINAGSANSTATSTANGGAGIVR